MTSSAFDVDAFGRRHIGTTPADHGLMLAALGYDSLDALMSAAVPTSIRMGEVLNSAIPAAATEREALDELAVLASQNTVRTIDDRARLLRHRHARGRCSATCSRTRAGTPRTRPYQPEISQGRLEALINFQTMVSDLTGLDTANASMLDESTAVVEGMLLTRRASKSASNRFVVDADALPQTLALLASRAEAVGIELVVAELAETTDVAALGEHFGLFVQYPGASGRVWNPASVIAASKAQGALVVVAADLLALALVTSPGELGADVAVGTSQRFGVPMGFGGPHAGYMAVRAGLERQMPGRLVGVSQDAAGHPAYRLSLQAREQHIRREKATSNICTAQVLLAVMASMYAVYHGPRGIRSIATQAAGKAKLLAGLARRPRPARRARRLLRHAPRARPRPRRRTSSRAARDLGVLLWEADEATVQVSVDETTTDRRPAPRDPRLRRPRRARPRRAHHARRRSRRHCAARRRTSSTRCSTRTTPRRR